MIFKRKKSERERGRERGRDREIDRQREREREREREKERKKERERDRQTDRQADTNRQRMHTHKNVHTCTEKQAHVNKQNKKLSSSPVFIDNVNKTAATHIDP